MVSTENTLGVILAGGLSRRMMGNEKTLLTLGDKPMLAHIASNLTAQIPSTILNANGDTTRFSFLDIPIAPDPIENNPGPLAGVLSGMRWARENAPDITHIITAAADTPFFPSDYVNQMIEQTNQQEAQIALASSDDRRHPVFGLWPVALAQELEHFLVIEENRKVMLFVERYKNIEVEFEVASFDPFFNINTPDDLKKGRRNTRRKLWGIVLSKKCFGIAGWKNSGKTSLVASLVSEFTNRGLTVSTIKHAHHNFDLDREGTDSFKHREAGSSEVILVSNRRWAIQHELREKDEPKLEAFLEKLSPCDLVLIEGYKKEDIPKVEIIGELSETREYLWKTDSNIKAIACDEEVADCALPRFNRDDVAQIADFISDHHKLNS